MDIPAMMHRLLDGMPPWVKVTTFLLLLVVSIYLVLAPRLLTSQVVAKTSHGGYVPYRAAEVQMELLGHVFRFKTNETGHVTIPVVNRVPFSLKFYIFHEDDRAWHPIDLNLKNVFLDSVRIIVNESPPLFSIDFAEGGFQSRIAALFTSNLINVAQAEIQLRPATNDNSDADILLPVTVESPPESVSDVIIGIVSEVTGLLPDEVGVDFKLIGNQEITYIQRIQIVEGIEKEFEINVPDEHWRSIDSVGAWTRYANERVELETLIPDIHTYRNSYNWAEIQSVSDEYTPIFNPIQLDGGR